jgi:hypothetical protein
MSSVNIGDLSTYIYIFHEKDFFSHITDNSSVSTGLVESIGSVLMKAWSSEARTEEWSLARLKQEDLVTDNI